MGISLTYDSKILYGQKIDQSEIMQNQTYKNRVSLIKAQLTWDLYEYNKYPK